MVKIFLYLCSPNTVQLAQLVESWIVVPVVVGSSPTLHPRNEAGAPDLGHLLYYWPVRALEIPQIRVVVTAAGELQTADINQIGILEHLHAQNSVAVCPTAHGTVGVFKD